MTARPDPSTFELDAFLQQQERTSMLRFIACGSVDHGKSTLIGRLLYEAKFLFEDQMASLATDPRVRDARRDLDFSLLLDSLAAERERRSPSTSPTVSSTPSGACSSSPTPGARAIHPQHGDRRITADLTLILVNARRAHAPDQTSQPDRVTLGVRPVPGGQQDGSSAGPRRSWRSRTSSAPSRRSSTSARSPAFPRPAARNVVVRSQTMDGIAGRPCSAFGGGRVPAETHRLPFRLPAQLVNRPTPDFAATVGDRER